MSWTQITSSRQIIVGNVLCSMDGISHTVHISKVSQKCLRFNMSIHQPNGWTLKNIMLDVVFFYHDNAVSTAGHIELSPWQRCPSQQCPALFAAPAAGLLLRLLDHTAQWRCSRLSVCGVCTVCGLYTGIELDVAYWFQSKVFWASRL